MKIYHQKQCRTCGLVLNMNYHRCPFCKNTNLEHTSFNEFGETQ